MVQAEPGNNKTCKLLSPSIFFYLLLPHSWFCCSITICLTSRSTSCSVVKHLSLTDSKAVFPAMYGSNVWKGGWGWMEKLKKLRTT